MSIPRKWASQSIVSLLFVGAFLLLWFGVGRHPYPFLALNIYLVEEQTKSLLYTTRVEPGEEVILKYTHSSDGTPVEQVFEVSEAETLELREERYRWYGAGLEFGSEYEVTFEDGWIRVTGYDRIFESLPIRVAATVPQVLAFSDTEILLAELAPAAARLVITVERRQQPWYRILNNNIQ